MWVCALSIWILVFLLFVFFFLLFKWDHCQYKFTQVRISQQNNFHKFNIRLLYMTNNIKSNLQTFNAWLKGRVNYPQKTQNKHMNHRLLALNYCVLRLYLRTQYSDSCSYLKEGIWRESEDAKRFNTQIWFISVIFVNKDGLYPSKKGWF